MRYIFIRILCNSVAEAETCMPRHEGIGPIPVTSAPAGGVSCNQLNKTEVEVFIRNDGLQTVAYRVVPRF
jgi:hypothetical protein